MNFVTHTFCVSWDDYWQSFIYWAILVVQKSHLVTVYSPLIYRLIFFFFATILLKIINKQQCQQRHWSEVLFSYSGFGLGTSFNELVKYFLLLKVFLKNPELKNPEMNCHLFFKILVEFPSEAIMSRAFICWEFVAFFIYLFCVWVYCIGE